MSQSVKGSRDLRKLIPPCHLVNDAEDNWNTPAGSLNGWEIYVNDVGTQWALYRTYVDLAGWAKDDVTAFTQGAAFQEAERWVATLGGLIPILNAWDMVSVNYIEDRAFNNDRFGPLGAPYNWEAPGMSGSNYNLEEILAGRYRSFAQSQDITATTQTNLQVWGAGDATAGDRIYITRAILLTGNTVYPGSMFIPPMAVVIPTLMVKEKDLVYMERLRRSYVLNDNRP